MTSPYGRGYFHLGVHHLPPDRASELMREISAYSQIDGQPGQRMDLREKNVPLLIEMVGRLGDDFRLVVAGDGPLAGWLESEVKARAPGRVRLLGHIGDRANLRGRRSPHGRG